MIDDRAAMLTGQARYVADTVAAAALAPSWGPAAHAVFVRSQIGHGYVTVRADEARAQPGVLAVVDASLLSLIHI